MAHLLCSTRWKPSTRVWRERSRKGSTLKPCCSGWPARRKTRRKARRRSWKNGKHNSKASKLFSADGRGFSRIRLFHHRDILRLRSGRAPTRRTPPNRRFGRGHSPGDSTRTASVLELWSRVSMSSSLTAYCEAHTMDFSVREQRNAILILFAFPAPSRFLPLGARSPKLESMTRLSVWDACCVETLRTTT